MKKEKSQENLAKKAILQYKDENEMSMSKGLRLQEVFANAHDWEVDTNQDKMNDIENLIWSTRGCFQTTCSEYNRTTMDEKISLLRNLSKNNNLDIFQLAMRMKIMGIEDLNKDIDDLDLVLGMSAIIDHLLKET